MSGNAVHFPGFGQPVEGYLAVPQSGSGKGLIVLQEWWGLVPHIKSVCDRFADVGFTALAPDLFGGQRTTDPSDAETLMMALNIDKTEKTLQAAVNWLIDQPSVSTKAVGVVGFCMGGALALLSATTDPDVCACVNFYGIHPHVKPNYENFGGPVLGIFAEHDGGTNAAAVAALESSLSKANVAHELIVFPGVDHAFFNDTRPEVYNAVAAARAWTMTVEFLNIHVR